MNNLKPWLPVYLYAIFIFILSSIPKLPEIGPDFLNADKLLHVIEYGILGLLLARAFKNSSSNFNNNLSLRGRSLHQGGQAWQSNLSSEKILLITVIISCLYGITDEIHQFFVPGRAPSVWDVLFDTAGAFFGCVIWTRKKRRLK